MERDASKAAADTEWSTTEGDESCSAVVVVPWDEGDERLDFFCDDYYQNAVGHTATYLKLARATVATVSTRAIHRAIGFLFHNTAGAVHKNGLSVSDQSSSSIAPHGSTNNKNKDLFARFRKHLLGGKISTPHAVLSALEFFASSVWLSPMEREQALLEARRHHAELYRAWMEVDDAAHDATASAEERARKLQHAEEFREIVDAAHRDVQRLAQA